MRYIVVVALFFQLLFGSFGGGSYRMDRYVLELLDIPQEFLYSKSFLETKRRYARYKNHQFFDVDRPETYFIPDLVKILNQEDVPEVFLFLAMAESNFAAHARSGKRAVGIWQFLAPTARKFGLRVDRFVDERKDPYKSTRAAIRYLKRLHKMFGKWYLAALAYNAGEGKVLRAIKRAGTDDVMVLIDPKKRYLPRESRLYLSKIVMLALISNDPTSRVSSELAYILTRGEEYEIMPVEVGGAQPLKSVAEQIQLRYSFLKRLNPHIRWGITPPDVKSYTIYIPKLKYNAFLANYTPIRDIKLANAIKKRFYRGTSFVYRVKRGDTLYSIARRYGVKVALLKRVNRLRSHLLRPGQRLRIPLKHKRHIYRVKRGDTIIKIAKRFGVHPKKLKRWNNKRNNFLRVGERLVILY